jgi:hypothetical protein
VADLPDDIAARAEDLATKGGVSPKRGRIVACVELRPEWSYADVQDALDMGSRGNVGKEVGEYRNVYEEACWLAENGPDL